MSTPGDEHAGADTGEPRQEEGIRGHMGLHVLGGGGWRARFARAPRTSCGGFTPSHEVGNAHICALASLGGSPVEWRDSAD